MHINFAMNPAGRSALHANNIHQGMQRQQAASQARNAQTTGIGQKRDKTTISPQGKVMNLIENLVKQKENVMQQKSDLMTRTLENGKSMKSIEVQLELFEEKLVNLDEQISQATSSLAEGMMEQVKEQAAKKKDESETEEEAEAKHLSKIAYAADGTKQAQVISSVQTKVEGEIKVKESENKLAQIDIERMKSKAIGNPSVNVEDMIRSARQMIQEKKETIKDLKSQAGNLSSMQSKAMEKDKDALEELRADGENVPEKKDEEQSEV